jgi:hypothetical protein
MRILTFVWSSANDLPGKVSGENAAIIFRIDLPFLFCAFAFVGAVFIGMF